MAPTIRLRGPIRRGAAVLVLTGAAPRELDRARELAARMTRTHLLVAVDGGLRTCLARRGRPDLYVGDRDSCGKLPGDLEAQIYPQDKDFSDLAGGLREMRRRRIPVIVVAGMLGGRLDHEWGNLFELASHAKGFAGILAPTDRGLVVISARGCRATTKRGQTVSLFCLGGSCTVTLRGTHWKLERRRLHPGSHGLSNVTGTALDLTVHAGCAGLVFP